MTFQVILAIGLLVVMESEGLSEEELIDSLFYRCDIHEKGKVQINTIIEFLKNCLGNGNVCIPFLIFSNGVHPSQAWTL